MSKGGSTDTSGMQRAAEQSNALQERIYEESVARGQPFYDIGLGGANILADYLGINRAPQQRQSVYDSLLPQFTSTTTTAVPAAAMGAPGSPYQRPMSNQEYAQAMSNAQNATRRDELRRQWEAQWADMSDQSKGYSAAFSPTQTQSVVDYAGLNAAVDAQLAGQERPDYFGSLLQPFSAESFQTDPGYQFRQTEGQKAIERRLAAQGKTFSPEAAKALADYNQGLAAQEYGQAYNRYNIDQSNIYNRLAGLMGAGQQQAGQLDVLGQNFGQNVANTNISLANAVAAADQADSSRRQSMFNTLLGTGAQVGSAMLLASDKELKENIEHVGNSNGFPLYQFNYKGDSKRYEGVMAQDVLKTKPEAVVVGRDGFYRVDYGMLGLQMREV